jgi:hypothetical protein
LCKERRKAGGDSQLTAGAWGLQEVVMVAADRDTVRHRRSHRADPLQDQRELPGRGEQLEESRFAYDWKRGGACGAPRSARS